MRRRSVVIPAYNEARRLPPSLARVLAWLGPDDEVLVVDDGSTDGTATIAVATGDPRVRVLPLGRNRGKGAAVRAGMLAATGDRVLFSDADLSTPIEEMAVLERALDAGADVAIGSRGHPEARVEVRQAPWRERSGRVFHLVVRRVAGLPAWRDTQCGFKLFRREAAQRVFEAVTVEGVAFDVQALQIAVRLGLRVEEVPVRWRDDPDSRLRMARDGARAAWDVWRLRGR